MIWASPQTERFGALSIPTTRGRRGERLASSLLAGVFELDLFSPGTERKANLAFFYLVATLQDVQQDTVEQDAMAARHAGVLGTLKKRTRA